MGFLRKYYKLKVRQKRKNISNEADWVENVDQQKTKVLEIQFKIASTDIEIDRMVYELYGLSEEEIGIVEEN